MSRGVLLHCLDHPPVCGFADVFEPGEQVLVHDFLADGADEALDVSILVWLAGPDALDGYTAALGPSGECRAQKIRAVVRTHQLQQAVVALELFEHAHLMIGIDRGVNDAQDVPVEVVDYIEGSEPQPASQRVAHEVDRPDTVGQPGHVKRYPFTLGQAPLGGPSQVELHRLVHPLDSLGVPVRPCLSQLAAVLPEAADGMLLNPLGQRSDQLYIAHLPVQRRRIPGRPRQPMQ